MFENVCRQQIQLIDSNQLSYQLIFVEVVFSFFLQDIYSTKHDIISVPIQNQTKLRLSIHCWEVIHYLMETPLLTIQAVEQIILQEVRPCPFIQILS